MRDPVSRSRRAFIGVLNGSRHSSSSQSNDSRGWLAWTPMNGAVSFHDRGPPEYPLEDRYPTRLNHWATGRVVSRTLHAVAAAPAGSIDGGQGSARPLSNERLAAIAHHPRPWPLSFAFVWNTNGLLFVSLAQRRLKPRRVCMKNEGRARRLPSARRNTPPRIRPGPSYCAWAGTGGG